MLVHWYNAGIRVVGAFGQQFHDMVEIASPADARLFVAFTTKQLDALAALTSGAALLQEIARSGHRCTIACAKRKGSQTTAESESASTLVDRFPRSFRPPHKLAPDPPAASSAESHQKKMEWLRKNPGSMKGWQLDQPAAYYAEELRRVVNRSGVPRQVLAGLVGKTEQQLEEMMAGTREVDDTTNYKLQLYLYEHLTPGRGINTYIAFDAGVRSQCAEAAKGDWVDGESQVPPIVLGHELIHAWRMMVGRRIYKGGVGEEHMTAGLPPYTTMKFSENKLRVDAKLALRDFYSVMQPQLDEVEIAMTASAPYLTRQAAYAKFWAASVG